MVAGCTALAPALFFLLLLLLLLFRAENAPSPGAEKALCFFGISSEGKDAAQREGAARRRALRVLRLCL